MVLCVASRSVVEWTQAQLSFDSERYFCYLVREEQSALGPRGANASVALCLVQLPVVGLSDHFFSQYTITGLCLHTLPHKAQVTDQTVQRRLKESSTPGAGQAAPVSCAKSIFDYTTLGIRNWGLPGIIPFY
jgi:hypothetical protein